MRSVKFLSGLYEQYIGGKIEKNEAEGKMFRWLLNNFGRFNLFEGSKDNWEEFLSWLYPRFAKAIDQYKDTGSSFDAYINGLIYNAAKEYRLRANDHYLTEFACWKARAEELLLRENEPEYLESDTTFFIPEGIRPKQILFLLLKSYHSVSDEIVDKAAKIIGIDRKKLVKLLDEVKMLRFAHEEKILDLRERLHSQYYRCLAYQRRLMKSQPGTDYNEKMKQRLERARKRYRTMKKRLSSMRVTASNRLIAGILGVPKGTVDSAIFALKKHLAVYTPRRVG